MNNTTNNNEENKVVDFKETEQENNNDIPEVEIEEKKKPGKIGRAFKSKKTRRIAIGTAIVVIATAVYKIGKRYVMKKISACDKGDYSDGFTGAEEDFYEDGRSTTDEHVE